jgi:hypothetical protein
MSDIRFVSMPTDEARGFQAGAPDANGQAPERHISDGAGVPCRHCQRHVARGEPYLILCYRPFPAPQPYAESGPIFLHAEPCARYPEVGDAPPMLLGWQRVLVRGYGADDRIVYGTGEAVPSAEMPATARRIFERDDVRYIHVRSANNNCYQMRIERGSGR